MPDVLDPPGFPCPVGCGEQAGRGDAPCARCLPAVDVLQLSAKQVDELARWLLAAITDAALDVLAEPRPGVPHIELDGGWCRACKPAAVAVDRLELHHTAVLRYLNSRAQLAHWVAKGRDLDRGRRIVAPLVATLCALALGPYRDRGGCPVDL